MGRLGVAATALALLFGSIGPGQAADRTPDRWLDLLSSVSDFTDRAIEYGGMTVTEDFGADQSSTVHVDFRHGYLISDDGVGSRLANWAGQYFQPIDALYSTDRTDKALRLLGATDAQWIRWPSELEPVSSWHPAVALMLSREDGITAVEVAVGQGDVKDYAVQVADGSTMRVTVANDRISVGVVWTTGSAYHMQWSLGTRRVEPPPPNSIVDSRDLLKAEGAVEALDMVRSVKRDLRSQLSRTSRPVRLIRELARKRLGLLLVKNVKAGVRARLRHRYVNRSWRITAKGGTLRVVTKDHLPPGWEPPRRIIDPAPPREPSDSGLAAFRRLVESLVWAQQWTGMRVSVYGLPTLSFDDESGIVASLGADGSPMDLYGRGGMQCTRITAESEAVERALRLIGKPGADFTCGQDTSLAWATIFRPIGVRMPLLQLIFDSNVSADASSIAENIPVFGDVRYEFDGPALVRFSLGSDRMDPASLFVSYTYDPQHLQMPAREQRVSYVRYQGALLAQRAAKLVARNARRLRTCMNAGQSNPRRCDLNYRTRILTLRAGKYRVWIKTAFSYDSRDVVAGRDGTYRVRNVIHRQAGVGN